MNSRRTPRRRDREGYVSLLAMSFAFGLAVFGGALAVGLRTYLAAGAAEQRDILDRLTLESAASEALGRLAAGESHSIRPSRPRDLLLNQRSVSVDLSLPEGKRDLRGDPDPTLLEALKERGLRAVPNRAPPSRFETLEALSRSWRLSAAEEDCLRQVTTVGRAPEDFRPEAAAGEGDGLARSVTAGDQVDLRLSLSGQPQAKVLWVRARFTGAANRPWRVHDYRLLHLGRSEMSCLPLKEGIPPRVHLSR